MGKRKSKRKKQFILVSIGKTCVLFMDLCWWDKDNSLGSKSMLTILCITNNKLYSRILLIHNVCTSIHIIPPHPHSLTYTVDIRHRYTYKSLVTQLQSYCRNRPEKWGILENSGREALLYLIEIYSSDRLIMRFRTGKFIHPNLVQALRYKCSKFGH